MGCLIENINGMYCNDYILNTNLAIFYISILHLCMQVDEFESSLPVQRYPRAQDLSAFHQPPLDTCGCQIPLEHT